MTQRRIWVDCEPGAVRPWRLERVDDTVWITFDDGVPRPLGVTAEALPAMRRFLEEIERVGAVPATQMIQGERSS